MLGSCRQKASIELESDVKNLRLAIGDIHLKHRSMVRALQNYSDIDAKNKAELKRLKGNLFYVVKIGMFICNRDIIIIIIIIGFLDVYIISCHLSRCSMLDIFLTHL